MPEPTDPRLYESVRVAVYKRYPKHSAYRSGLLVQEYKKAFARKHGNADPYVGKRGNAGLTRWFREKWRNESGCVGYDNRNTLYRPTVRVTRETPKTWAEIPKSRIGNYRNEKKKTGRKPSLLMVSCVQGTRLFLETTINGSAGHV